VTLRPSLRPILLALAAALAMSATQAQSNVQRAAKYYDDALTRYERKDFAGASLQLKNALQLDRKLLAAHLLLGRSLLANGDVKAAEAAFEEAIAQGVNKAEVARDLGQVYLMLGESKKLLDRITPSGVPESMLADIQTMRGSAYAMAGNPGAASAAFAEARRLRPDAAESYIAEAPLVLRAGDTDKARALAKKATELAPANPMAWTQLANAQQSAGDLAGALASLDRALAINPKLVDALVARATVLIGLRRSAEAAKLLADLKEAKVIEPRASYLRAALAAAAGDTKTAQAEYTDAATRIDTLPAGVRMGSEPLLLAGALSHRALGHPERAREYVEAILARNGRHFAAQLLMARLQLEAGEFNRATILLDNLARIAPNDPQVLYLLGSASLSKRQYARAAELFERAARGGGDASEARRELAFSQFGLGQDKAALANLEGVYAKDPHDTRAGIELAIYYARHGEGDKAVKIADAMFRRDPDNLMLLNFLGNIKGRLGDNAGMRAAYERVLAKDPKFRQTVINLSMLDTDEGKFDAARARLTAWVKDHPDDAEAWFQLGAVEQRAGKPVAAAEAWTKADGMQGKDPRPGLALVDLLLQQRQAPRAQAAARTLAGKYPESVPVLQTLARAHLAARDLTMANQALQDASKYAGFDAAAQVDIARMMLAADNAAGAQYALGKALQASPDDISALATLVEVAARKRDAPAVDAALKQLQAKHPGKVPTLLISGHVAFSRGQLSQATDLYREAYAKESAPPIALVLAQAYLADKKPDQALALLGDAVRKDPRNPLALQALAQVQAASGRDAEARDTLAALLALRPDDPDALVGYSQVLFRLNDPKALPTAEKAMKRQPDNPALAANYGWMLVQKGDLDNGVRILREARLRAPGDGAIRWSLASALAKAGRKAEARDELKAALASNPPPPPGPTLDALKTELGL